ncbi:hypothetical protein [Bradyrhizobium sp. 150]|uniref:hypothetical protein n=1 Tax=Bradyrhizobium sp. 150 TaxID=2782625 RepID=UPI001FFBCDC5|nr:hypothetical protein [Bradyrhizobium sp. 150]MCK1671707.1 hypothetical protein [Bradyrhizobium sp. 150]
MEESVALPSLRMIRKHCVPCSVIMTWKDATAHLGDIFSMAFEKGRNVEAILVPHPLTGPVAVKHRLEESGGVALLFEAARRQLHGF